MARTALGSRTRRFLVGSPAPGAPLLLWPLTQNLLAAAKGAISLHSLSCQQREGDVVGTESVCVNALAVNDIGCASPCEPRAAFCKASIIGVC